MFRMRLWLIPLRVTMYILSNIIPKRLAKVVGADLSKYHPRKCVAVLQQFNGLLNRHHTADSYNYNVEGKNLIIVFWPENTTTDSIQHYLDFGFDRLDFMYRNLEKLEIAD